MGDSVPAGSEKLRSLLFILLLSLLLIGVYSKTVSYDFIWDDSFLILQDEKIKRDGMLSEILTQPFGPVDRGRHSAYYRPVVTASYAFNYRWSGSDPASYHAVNIALHVLVGFVVFAFVRVLTGSVATSCAATLLFALHPAHVPSVAWVSGRTDILCALFLLSGLTLYAKGLSQPGSPVLRWLSLPLFLLAMASKELAFVFPATLLLIDLQRAEWCWRSALRRLDRLFYAAACVLLAVYVIVHGAVVESVGSSMGLSTVIQRIPNGIVNFVEYLRILLFPYPLNDFYFRPSGIRIPSIILSALILLVLSGQIFFIRRHPTLLFCSLWIALLLLPVLGLVAISSGYAVADHLTYLPALGSALFMAELVRVIAKRRLSKKGVVAALYGVVGVVAILFTLLTYSGMQRWRDDITLFTRLAEVSSSGKASELLGNAFMDRERWPEAAAAFQEGLSRNPDDWRLWYGLSLVSIEQGGLGRAKQQLLTAVRHGATKAQVYNNLGNIHLLEKDLTAARDAYSRALELSPHNYEAYYNLGMVSLQLGERQNAARNLKRFIEMAPPTFDAQKREARRFMLGLGVSP